MALDFSCRNSFDTRGRDRNFDSSSLQYGHPNRTSSPRPQSPLTVSNGQKSNGWSNSRTADYSNPRPQVPNQIEKDWEAFRATIPKASVTYPTLPPSMRPSNAGSTLYLKQLENTQTGYQSHDKSSSYNDYQTNNASNFTHSVGLSRTSSYSYAKQAPPAQKPAQSNRYESQTDPRGPLPDILQPVLKKKSTFSFWLMLGSCSIVCLSLLTYLLKKNPVEPQNFLHPEIEAMRNNTLLSQKPNSPPEKENSPPEVHFDSDLQKHHAMAAANSNQPSINDILGLQHEKFLSNLESLLGQTTQQHIFGANRLHQALLDHQVQQTRAAGDLSLATLDRVYRILRTAKKPPATEGPKMVMNTTAVTNVGDRPTHATPGQSIAIILAILLLFTFMVIIGILLCIDTDDAVQNKPDYLFSENEFSTADVGDHAGKIEKKIQTETTLDFHPRKYPEQERKLLKCTQENSRECTICATAPTSMPGSSPKNSSIQGFESMNSNSCIEEPSNILRVDNLLSISVICSQRQKSTSRDQHLEIAMWHGIDLAPYQPKNPQELFLQDQSASDKLVRVDQTTQTDQTVASPPPTTRDTNFLGLLASRAPVHPAAAFSKEKVYTNMQLVRQTKLEPLPSPPSYTLADQPPGKPNLDPKPALKDPEPNAESKVHHSVKRPRQASYKEKQPTYPNSKIERIRPDDPGINPNLMSINQRLHPASNPEDFRFKQSLLPESNPEDFRFKQRLPPTCHSNHSNNRSPHTTYPNNTRSRQRVLPETNDAGGGAGDDPQRNQGEDGPNQLPQRPGRGHDDPGPPNSNADDSELVDDSSIQRLRPGFTIATLNIQRKNQRLDYEGLSVLGLQEAKFLSANALPNGFLTNNGGLKTWTKAPHRNLLQLPFLTLIQTVQDQEELLVLNVHLDHDTANRSTQTRKLDGLLKHLQMMDRTNNIVLLGDFNCSQRELETLPLKILPNLEPTWRRTGNDNQVGCLDHIMVSQHLSFTLRIQPGIGDHMMVQAVLSGIAKCRPNKVNLDMPGLCRPKTANIRWEQLDYFPNVDFRAIYTGKRVYQALDPEEFEETRTSRQQGIREDPVTTRADWATIAACLRLRPLTTTAPLLDEQSKPIRCNRVLARVMLGALEEATAQRYRVIKPKGISFSHWSREDLDDMLERLRVQAKALIKASKAAGEDGVAPEGVKRLCTENPENCLSLLQDALARPNALSGRLTLAPKKDGKRRPIQIVNQVRLQLERIVLDKLQLTGILRHPEDLYGFMRHKSVYQPIERVVEALKAAPTPAYFLDFAKAFNTVLLDPIIRHLRRAIPDEPQYLDLLEQIVYGDNVKIGGKYYQADAGLPQGAVLSPFLFNICMDLAFSRIKHEFRDIQTISFADDVCILGQCDLLRIERIFLDYGLRLNKQKCCTFNTTSPGIKKANATVYLGIKITCKGEIQGFHSLEALARETAKAMSLKRFCSIKAFQLARTYIKSKIMFSVRAAEDQTKYNQLWVASAKTAMRLPRSLPQPTFIAFEARITSRRHSKQEVAKLVDLMRKHDHISSEEIMKVTPEMIGEPFDHIDQKLRQLQDTRSRYSTYQQVRLRENPSQDQHQQQHQRQRQQQAQQNRAQDNNDAGEPAPLEPRDPKHPVIHLMGTLNQKERHNIMERMRGRLRAHGFTPKFEQTPTAARVQFITVANDTEELKNRAQVYLKPLLPFEFDKNLEGVVDLANIALQ